MQFLKSLLIIPYMFFIFYAFILALQSVFNDSTVETGAALLLTTAPTVIILLLAQIFGRNFHADRRIWILIPALIGFIWSYFIDSRVFDADVIIQITRTAALFTFIYVYWFTRLHLEVSSIKVGDTMPECHFKDHLGTIVTSIQLQDKPTFYLFFRGNWCPLCMAQIREVAKQYQQIEDMGARVALVSNQTDRQTMKLAKKFDVNFLFLRDTDGNVADSLGLYHKEGVPVPYRLTYTADTLLPTILLVGTDGVIKMLERTDDYTVRPEPAVMLKALKEN